MITVVPLPFDHALSIRLDDREICIMPAKTACTVYELEKAFNRIADEVISEVVADLDSPQVEDWA